MNKARKKLSQIDNLKVIAITGSFGKSIVKEILYLIVKDHYKVFASQGNVQDVGGIANSILNNVNFLADVLLLEVQPKANVIRDVGKIVRPDIAVITAASEQNISDHQIFERKLLDLYEIVEVLKDNGVIVLNADSPLCLRIASKSRKRERMYSTKKQSNIWATDIKSRKDRIEFNVHFKEDVARFEVRMLGEHNVSNVLGAVTCALELGMNLSDIAESIRKGSKSRQIGRLSITRSRFGFRMIDDTWHSNPLGFSAALDFLKGLRGTRKIVVTIGITGSEQSKKDQYQKLAKQITKICDVLVTTDLALRDAVRETSKNFEIIFDKGIDKQLKYLKESVNRNDIVLFEGPNVRLMEEMA